MAEIQGGSRSLSARLYADLVGKPFRAHARDGAAYDCLGLAIELQLRQGRRVPDFLSTAEELERQFRDGVLGPCVRLDEAEPGCAVLMRGLGDAGVHIGTMLDRFRMIHASEPASSVVIEVLAQSRWRMRVIGFYRPEVSR